MQQEKAQPSEHPNASARKHDIVVFGASGFTGKFVVKELIRLRDIGQSFTFAISGRDRQKLQGPMHHSCSR